MRLHKELRVRMDPARLPVDVTGKWQATVKYDWGDTYDTIFDFEIDGSKLSGEAGYAADERVTGGKYWTERWPEIESVLQPNPGYHSPGASQASKKVITTKELSKGSPSSSPSRLTTHPTVSTDRLPSLHIKSNLLHTKNSDRTSAPSRPRCETAKLSCSRATKVLRHRGRTFVQGAVLQVGRPVCQHQRLRRIAVAVTGLNDSSLKAPLSALMPELRDAGLNAIEAYHSDHDEQHTRLYLELAQKYGMLVTGGSNFHGAIKPEVKLGTGYRGNLHVPDDLLDSLRPR